MNKTEKNEVIEVLKGKFSQYSNFYITDTESLTVAQVTKLRGVCFNKQVEMKVAKNSLIKKALEGLDAKKYAGVLDSLHNVTALMFSENPKEPALILSSFRTENKKDKPVLKAAFINGDVYVGDDNLKALTKIKTKNELIGELIGLLQSPAQRVIAALLNGKVESDTAAPTEVVTPSVEATPVTPPAAEVTPKVDAVVAPTTAVEVSPTDNTAVPPTPVEPTSETSAAKEPETPEAIKKHDEI